MILKTIQDNGHLRVKDENGKVIHIGVFDLHEGYAGIIPFFEQFLPIYNEDMSDTGDDSDE